jgi:hypothetical protein
MKKTVIWVTDARKKSSSENRGFSPWENKDLLGK